MQFYYGEQNILRALDEAQFWKRQEAEHTTLIPVITPNLEAEYAGRLETLGNEINQLEEESVKFITSVVRSRGVVGRDLKVQMLNFIKRCVEQSKDFIALMTEMLENSRAVHANAVSQTVIKHMIRESQYFVGIEQLITGS